MRVINLKIVTQTGFKILSRVEIASFEKATGQHAKPELDLVEPGAMFGDKMEHMVMARITQEGTPLYSLAQGPWAQREPGTTEPPGPVSIEVIHHPIVTLHRRQLVDHMAQMRRNIGTGASPAEIPDHLTRWHHKRGDQGPRPMTGVFVLAFGRFARFNGLRGVLALQNLHAGLFIAADDHASLFKET